MQMNLRIRTNVNFLILLLGICFLLNGISELWRLEKILNNGNESGLGGFALWASGWIQIVLGFVLGFVGFVNLMKGQKKKS